MAIYHQAERNESFASFQNTFEIFGLFKVMLNYLSLEAV